MVENEYEYFLRADLSAYLGEWVAIVNRNVVAHDKTFKKTFEEAQRKHPGEEPFFAKVPTKAAMIL
jgi:hypothetical protein